MNSFRVLLVALVAVILAKSAHAEPPARHKFDARDLAQIPGAAREQFERGEALLEAGDAAAALPLLQQVTTEAPENALTFRRVCEALTALGRRDEAIKTCMGAMSRRGTAMDFRAYVGALTSGGKPLTPDAMSQAIVFARRARELMPDQPWGYAAQCDVARSLGDAEMSNECVKQLLRVAPDHPETKRTLALMAKPGAHRMVLGWCALALACIGTVIHAIGRTRRRTLARGSAVVVGCWLAGFMLILPGSAKASIDEAAPAPPKEAPAAPKNADTPPPELGETPVPGAFSKFQVDDNDPIGSLPPAEKLHKDPLQFGYLLMDLTDRADKATERGDHAAAVKFWQALAKITPDRSLAFSKMCTAYEAQGMLEKAAYSCGAALERTGATLKDYIRFVGLMLSKKGKLVEGELATIDKVLDHLKTDDAGRGVLDELSCRVGMKTWSVARLEPCTAALIANRPDHPNTVYFQWGLAVARGNAKEAWALIDRARTVGVKPEDIRDMEKVTAKLEERWKSKLGLALGALVVIGAGVGLYLSLRRSSRAVNDARPSGVTV